MSTPGNSINDATTGITGFTGTAFTATAVTQYNALVGGATTSTLTNVAPSATSGVPLISQGASANPAFGTAVVAGGGSGRTTATEYAVICGGTTTTGAHQSIAGVGTSGQVLTSNGASNLPTFQANTGGSGAWVKITSTTASGSATVDFTGLSATYQHYVVLMDNVTPSSFNNNLRLRTSADGGSTFDTTLYFSEILYGTTTTAVAANPGAATIYLAHLNGLTNGDVLSGNVYIYNPSAANYAAISAMTAYGQNSAGSSIGKVACCSGHHQVAEAVDAIRFYMGSDNIATGTFTLYGIKA